MLRRDERGASGGVLGACIDKGIGDPVFRSNMLSNSEK